MRPPWLLLAPLLLAVLVPPNAAAFLPEPKPMSRQAAKDRKELAPAVPAVDAVSREKVARCVARLTALRKRIVSECVMAEGICYDRLACTFEKESVVSCGGTIDELTELYQKSRRTPCE